MTYEEYLDICAADENLGVAQMVDAERVRVNDGVFDFPVMAAKALAEPILRPENFMIQRNFHHGRLDAGSKRALKKEFEGVDALTFVNYHTLKRTHGDNLSKESLSRRRVPNNVLVEEGIVPKSPLYFKRAVMQDDGTYKRGMVSLKEISNNGRKKLGIQFSNLDYHGNPHNAGIFSRTVNSASYGAGFGYGKGETWIGRAPLTKRVKNRKNKRRRHRFERAQAQQAGFAGREGQ